MERQKRSWLTRTETVELFEQIRREMEFGVGTIAGVSRKLGVYRRMVREALHNAEPATSKPQRRRPGKLVEETSRFIAFRSRWRYQSEFCNPARGSENGSVEGKGRYFRRNHWVPVPEVRSLDELNVYLECCSNENRRRILSGRTETVGAARLTERSHLSPLAAEPFDLAEISFPTVDSLLCVRVRTNRYSVPSPPGTKVEARVHAAVVELRHEGKRVTWHERSYSRQQKILDLEHYLEVLRKKPGALPARLRWRSGGRQDAVRTRYGNYIGGKWSEPLTGRYFTSYSPANGQPIAEFARSGAADVEKALDAAHAVRSEWEHTPAAKRAELLLKVADVLQENLKTLAIAETIDNGKPIRETMNADVPLVIDHFRYFAACIRAEEGAACELDNDTVSYHFKEPLGVVGQIIPWNFPLLMAAWKLAPAIAAGNCVVIKPASNTPLSIMIFAELAGPILPPGVLNVISGPGGEMGRALASNKRISKIAFTGETTTGRLIMQYAAEPIIPQTMELGGKSPNIFFADVLDKEDDFLDKALEGFALFAFNKGEVCTCPSRALVQESIFDEFVERATARVAKIKVGNPLDSTTQMGPQVSKDQMNSILNYIQIGKQEGAKCLTGGERAHLGGDLENGYFLKPTVFTGDNKMRIFQEEIFGPVLSVTKFKDLEDAIRIGNDTVYGLGSGVWSRNVNNLYRVGREIKAGRCWTNCYHMYPAGAAFGGYKESGFGRETHKIILDHYQQTKNLLVSYSTKAQGLF